VSVNQILVGWGAAVDEVNDMAWLGAGLLEGMIWRLSDEVACVMSG
jgi:hypothetical protein